MRRRVDAQPVHLVNRLPAMLAGALRSALRRRLMRNVEAVEKPLPLPARNALGMIRLDPVPRNREAANTFSGLGRKMGRWKCPILLSHPSWSEQ